MIILDTNVVSEYLRSRPDERVREWFDSVDSDQVAVTTVTVAELRFGAALLPQGGRRVALEQTIDRLISRVFTGKIESFDFASTGPYASLRAERRMSGRPIASQDAQIAAICVSRQAVLATRNIKDFDGLGITLINPWEY
ncbi:type II toxin-antitoxin system VapC family toxin [Glycomyces sp. TRM65418]|uniref:type II toxin-antitoxin system VapC family toxin n=1 Tax=Glycomyces sp. TRM65418 TaxID=2867006 RepID=UPI001CE5A5FA|nr:type II toxin-antitoxin system VapC family toxin [Glycomyces sp. TRM65418]MCC3764864.1 type II toxin-antitoxin system VapC family toxin [Glycomyces sp. TRM65418]QZD54509.1 type II toxin-antitoxin system VapC family toxin [Glycomyces sp. TRM65418]